MGTAETRRTPAASANAAAGAGSMRAPPIPTATAAPAVIASSWALVVAGRRASGTSLATSARWEVVSALRPV